jgi:hypothetical protein
LDFLLTAVVLFADFCVAFPVVLAVDFCAALFGLIEISSH